MKKIQAFAIVAVIALIATSSAFAQTANTVQKMSGIKGISLRTYCSFSTLFRAQNAKCFDASKVAAINTASIGAFDIGSGSLQAAPIPAQTGSPSATIGGFIVPTAAPQVIERTVIVQGAPGPQGPAGQAGASAFGSFTNVPQVFWNGGGGSGSSGSTITNVITGTPLPVGGLPGQVLTLDASSSPLWLFPATTSTSSILTLGSLTNVNAENGLTIATTSTSTTIKLGGPLTQDTTIAQNAFNFNLNRGGFSFLNQGTTSIPLSSTFSLVASQFLGFNAQEGTHSVFAGVQRRSSPAYPIFEVQALDSATERRGYLGVGNEASSLGFTNGTTTNQLRADATRVRLNATTPSGSSSQITVSASGVSFGFDAQATTPGGKTYTFPKVDGLANAILATDGSGQLSFRSLAAIIASSSTSTIPTTGWSLLGNAGTNPSTDFLGTTDAQPLVFKTNNTERARFAANGNLTLLTNEQNASSSITVKGIHSDGRWGIFDEANNKLIQNRADQGILGFGTGDFVSYGFNSAMGIRGADVMIPHLVVSGNHNGPNNISQLRMESSSQTEYDYAGAYPNGANTYKISTILHAPLGGATRAPIAFGGRELNFFTGADDTGTPELTIAQNGNVGIGTTTPMRPLTVVGNEGGTLGMFQNTRAGAPSGVSFLATRADSSTSNRIGLFLNPNAAGDDRLATHASGVGDLWSFSRGGDLVGALGTSFDQRNGAIPARLSVMANDARPTALFQNSTQSYVQIKNGSGAFPQSYNVGVEAAGGTFNIIDANTTKTRLSINRNGAVQIYDRLSVGSYDFGLGNVGDSGFGNSAGAYMRYVQRAHIGDGALELFDSSNQLSTVISQSAIGTATEFNKSKKDIDFKILGTVDNNLFFADAALNQVRIGTSTSPALAKFSVFTDEVLGDALFARQLGGGDRTFAFGRDGLRTNTTGTFGNSMWSGDAGLEVYGATPARTVFRVQGHSGQTAPLQEWRDGAGSVLSALTANGSLGIGTSVPTEKLDVVGNININNGSAYMYAGTPVVRAIPATNNYFFGPSGNFTMTGVDNTSGGMRSLINNTTGRQNTSFGAETLRANTAGFANTAFGHDVLRANVSGELNTGLGVEALRENISGSGNIAIGVASLVLNTTGSFNTFVGHLSGAQNITGSNNTVIGANITGLPTNLMNTVIIADGSGNQRLFVDSVGNLGIGTNVPSRKLHIVSSGTGLVNGRVARFDNASASCAINPSFAFGIQCSSDRTLKKDIVAMDTSLASLAKLKPSMFRWSNEESTTPLQYGFIAQEIEEVFPSIVSTDEVTGLKSVAFGSLVPVTIKAMQEMNVALGDLSKDATVEEFSGSTIYKRFADTFKALTVAFKNITADKATVKELCLPKSDGTIICLNGDQVAAIAASASINVASVVEVTPAPTPITPSPVLPMPTQDAPVDETPVDVSESPANPAPGVILQPESVLPTVEAAPTIIQ